MSPRFLVWVQRSEDQVREILDRRENRGALRDCISGHALAVAENAAIAAPLKGPGGFRVYRFQCRDGDTILYLQFVLDVLSDAELAILSCTPVPM